MTRAYTGRLARGLTNRLSRELDARVHELPPYPITSWFLAQLKPAAIAARNTELLSLWGSQITPNLKHRTAPALMAALIENLVI